MRASERAEEEVAVFQISEIIFAMFFLLLLVIVNNCLKLRCFYLELFISSSGWCC